MALTDPELDLLRELLEDDPTEDVFVQVGEELLRRDQFVDARQILMDGIIAHQGDTEAWRLLVRAHLECSAYDDALDAWKRAAVDFDDEPEFFRLKILALERAGRANEAKAVVEDFEQRFGGVDVVVEAAKERLDAPPASDDLAAGDPYQTVKLAERYVSMGRPDRAVRVLRRIFYHHPEAISLQSRIEQLSDVGPEQDDYTDLSEELADPNLVPPVLTMPGPAITSASVAPAPNRETRPRQNAASVPGASAAGPAIDRLQDGPAYSAPLEVMNAAPGDVDADAPTEEVEIPVQRPSGKRTPAALEQFMEDARRKARGETADLEQEDTDEPEELPGLADVGMRRRKRRRSLIKR